MVRHWLRPLRRVPRLQPGRECEVTDQAEVRAMLGSPVRSVTPLQAQALIRECLRMHIITLDEAVLLMRRVSG